MGKRKFRLHRRKGYSHPPKESSLLVSLPRLHCGWELLRTSIKEADLGRWSYISTVDNDNVTICKFTASNPPMAYMTVKVFSSTPENNWNLHIGHKLISKHHINCLPLTIRSISDLYTILNAIDRCNLCNGSSDKKYTPLIESHNGNFHDQYGECMFHAMHASYMTLL